MEGKIVIMDDINDRKEVKSTDSELLCTAVLYSKKLGV